VAFDTFGSIYVADTANKRIVRTDDMNGTNWTTLTQSPVIGSYIFSFASPVGVAVDTAGRIYVADASTPTASVVRIDDMSGANWTTLSLGSGATPHSIAVDMGGMVLVGGGGLQIVDNMMQVVASGTALDEWFRPLLCLRRDAGSGASATAFGDQFQPAFADFFAECQHYQLLSNNRRHELRR
jgi:NHL repeat